MQNEYFLKLREKLSASHIKKYNVTINIARGTIFSGNNNTFEYREEDFSDNLNIIRHLNHLNINLDGCLEGFDRISEIIIIEYNIFDNELNTNYKYDIHFIYLRDCLGYINIKIATYINGSLIKETLLLFNIFRFKYNDNDDSDDDDYNGDCSDDNDDDDDSNDDDDSDDYNNDNNDNSNDNNNNDNDNDDLTNCLNDNNDDLTNCLNNNNDDDDLINFLKNNKSNKKSGLRINKELIDELLDYIIKKELIHNNFKYIIDRKEIKHEKTDMVKKIFFIN